MREPAQSLLDRLETAHEIDLRAQLAPPIPTTVINEMVGVPLAVLIQRNPGLRLAVDRSTLEIELPRLWWRYRPLPVQLG